MVKVKQINNKNSIEKQPKKTVKTEEYKLYQKYSRFLSENARKYFDELYLNFEYNGLHLRTSDIFNSLYDTKENKLKMVKQDKKMKSRLDKENRLRYN